MHVVQQSGGLRLLRIGTRLDRTRAHGEWTGLALLSPHGTEVVRGLLERLHSAFPSRFHEAENFRSISLTDLLAALLAIHQPVHICYIFGHWVDVDDAADLDTAFRLAGGGA